MVLLAGPSRPKRVGKHDVYRTDNTHGEWSIRIEPEGCQIDNYHSRGQTPHLHVPRAYAETVDLPGISEEFAVDVVRGHLLRHGKVVLDVLLMELKQA